MNENKKFFSKIGSNYLILALISIIFQILIINIIDFYYPVLIQNLDIQTVVGAFSNYILPLPIFIYLMHKLESEKIEKESLNAKRFFKYICITITLMWIGSITGTIITTLIGNTMSNEIINPIKQLIENSGIYINLILISIVAPIIEEIFFRKLLIDRTIKYGATLSILLSALLFALFHGNLSQFFYTFLIGGFFAYVYIKTGKITYTIILHMIINFIGSVLSTIFIQSLNNISAFNPLDIAIVLIYAICIISAIFIGLYAMVFNFKEIDLKDYKEIYLEKPVQTVMLNAGMMLFVLFHIITILRSLNIITII